MLFLFIPASGKHFFIYWKAIILIFDLFLLVEPFFYLVETNFLFFFNLFLLVENTIFDFTCIPVSGNNFFYLVESNYFNFPPFLASQKHFSILRKIFFSFSIYSCQFTTILPVLLEPFPFIHNYFSLYGKCH